ncbi:magnesium transporter CorA [Sphingomonas sp. Leaf33]|uniref:zinc transporter ZntB n=1 Tax=Sphingomonas sp. Leaf33 TaxID=1736215 RepID=UPI0007004CF5|nr:zinc transporter ZntB [Sphingomonas sp. Leaf33]KQN24864.1 magnesium transporter CorA [Sphingomonas sp. Leaf33]
MSGFAYALRDGSAEEVELRAAPSAAGDFVWVHLCVSNEHARAWLTDEAKLPDYVVEGLIAAETRPRCTPMDDGALVNLRGMTEADVGSDLLASVRIFASAGHVYTVMRRQLKALETVKRSVAAGRILDPGDLIAEFASAITEELDPVVADLGDRLDVCETQIEAIRAFRLRQRVNRVRVEAIGYRRFLNPQRAALEKLAALPADWLQDDDRVHLSSAADRAARMAEEVEAIRERAGLMHETLTDLRGELIDQRSLVIAIAAMVFLPLTFLTGLYGMNVEGLPFAKEPWAFDAILGMCALIAVGIVGWFSWRHWTR